MSWRSLGLAPLLVVALAGCINDTPADGPAHVEARISINDAMDAPALVDVLGASIEEHERNFVVTVTLREIVEDQIPSELEALSAEYAVIFGCWEMVGADVNISACVDFGMTDALSTTWRGLFFVDHWQGQPCDQSYGCLWEPAVSLIEGVPAEIRFEIPRALAPEAVPGVAIRNFSVRSELEGRPQMGLSDIAGRDVIAYACLENECVIQDTRPVPTLPEVVDEARSSDTMRLTRSPDLSLPPSSGVPFINAVRGNYAVGASGYRADLDVVQVDFEETLEEWTMIAHIAELPETGTHHFEVRLGIGNRWYNGGFDAFAGQVLEGWMAACATPRCSNPASIPYHIEHLPGTPGTIRFGGTWNDMYEHRAGELVTFGEAWMNEPAVWHGLYPPAPAEAGLYAGTQNVDSEQGPIPYTLQLPHGGRLAPPD